MRLINRIKRQCFKLSETVRRMRGNKKIIRHCSETVRNSEVVGRLRDIDMRDLALLVELIDGGHLSEITGKPVSEFHLDRKPDTIYRRLVRLERMGYVGRGYAKEREDTYFVTQEGITFFRGVEN